MDGPGSEPDSASVGPSAREVLRHGGVRALLISNFVLSTGIFLQAAALGKQVFDITGSELSIGLLGLAEFLPAVLLVLVTGTVADRFDRRRIVAIGLLAEAACSVGFLVYARSDPTSVGPIYLGAIAFGAARAFTTPAARSLPPMVAPAGGLPRVVAMYSATWTASLIVGPAASGFLYAVDPWVAYAVAAFLLLAGLVGTLAIRYLNPPEPRDPDQRMSLHRAMEGLRFIRRTPILLAAISLDLFAVLFGGAVALLPAIAEDRLGVGDVAYGWLRAAPGIGAAAMAMALAVFPVQRHVGRRLLYVVFVFGAATVVLGITRSYAVAFATLIVLSAADMISVFIRASIVQLVTPETKRGRVMAVEGVFIGASNELGAFESGVAAAVLGVPIAVVGGGVATMAIVVAWWFHFPSLRDVDRFSELQPAEG